MYILSTGCQWAALPKDLPPRSTVNDYFRRWDWDGTLGCIHHALYVKCRELAGREASPTAAIIRALGPRYGPQVDNQGRSIHLSNVMAGKRGAGPAPSLAPLFHQRHPGPTLRATDWRLSDGNDW